MHRQRITLPAIAALSAVVLAACGAQDEPTDAAPGAGQTSTPVVTTSPTPTETAESANAADVQFARDMIPHHAQAIVMAEVAARRAADPAVRELAEQIQAAQGPEIDQLTSWLTAWGEPAPDPDAMGGHGDMAGMMGPEEMAELAGAQGARLDRMFLTSMIEHHRGAVEMAREQIQRGQHPGAVEMAEEIVATQQAEIDTMRQLLAR